MMAGKTADPARMLRDDWDELLSVRPLEDIPVHGLGKRIPFIDEWLAHPHHDAFWHKCD